MPFDMQKFLHRYLGHITAFLYFYGHGDKRLAGRKYQIFQIDALRRSFKTTAC